MITKEKLEDNMSRLKNHIPTKPKEYTKEHPRTLNEALEKYSNIRTVNSFEICTYNYNIDNWPLPLWTNPSNVKIGIFNMLYYKKYSKAWGQKRPKKLKDFGFLWIPVAKKLLFKISIDESITEAFDVNIKYIKSRLKQNELISSKQIIIDEIFQAYKKKYWISAICTTFPIIDYVARKILKTNNLGVTISKICKLFEAIGFSEETTDHLMPHAFGMEKPYWEWEPEEKSIYDKIKNNKYGIIGPALSSFIKFSNNYYGYYKEDKEENNIINRHAILHGSINDFGNKENTIKLISYLYLILELEPILNIIFDE
jgi:hypothetical protein